MLTNGKEDKVKAIELTLVPKIFTNFETILSIESFYTRCFIKHSPAIRVFFRRVKIRSVKSVQVQNFAGYPLILGPGFTGQKHKNNLITQEKIHYMGNFS